jgi:hydrogenase maturation protease
VAAGEPRRVGVIGLGNVLMGDDAFGPWVAQVLLAGYDFAPGVSVEDLGTPGLDLIPYVAELDALVLVDTVRSDATPGTLRLYGRDSLLQHAPQPRLSPHDPGVKEALLTAEFAGVGPREVLLVGAVPQDSAMGVRLSTPLRGAVPRAVEEVLRELTRLGSPAIRRERPRPADIWWEAPADVAGRLLGDAAPQQGSAQELR